MTVSFKDMSADAFERLAKRLVEREFEGVPLDVKEIPVIGYWPFIVDYDRTTQKQLAVRALCCARWAELELPPWALPLPLTYRACVALFNGPHQGNRRPWLRGEYGLEAKEMGWRIERMRPFERFCAGKLGG